MGGSSEVHVRYENDKAILTNDAGDSLLLDNSNVRGPGGQLGYNDAALHTGPDDGYHRVTNWDPIDPDFNGMLTSNTDLMEFTAAGLVVKQPCVLMVEFELYGEGIPAGYDIEFGVHHIGDGGATVVTRSVKLIDMPARSWDVISGTTMVVTKEDEVPRTYTMHARSVTELDWWPAMKVVQVA